MRFRQAASRVQRLNKWSPLKEKRQRQKRRVLWLMNRSGPAAPLIDGHVRVAQRLKDDVLTTAAQENKCVISAACRPNIICGLMRKKRGLYPEREQQKQKQPGWAASPSRESSRTRTFTVHVWVGRHANMLTACEANGCHHSFGFFVRNCGVDVVLSERWEVGGLMARCHLCTVRTTR